MNEMQLTGLANLLSRLSTAHVDFLDAADVSIESMALRVGCVNIVVVRNEDNDLALEVGE